MQGSRKLGKIGLRDIKEILGEGFKPSLDANLLFDEYVVSVNPAIGLPDKYLGFFAYHYAASNVAVAFGIPSFALVDFNAPPNYSLEKIKSIMRDFIKEAKTYGTRIVGGHTARYEGLTMPLLSTTVIGPRVRERKKPERGDKVYVAGTLGLESLWLLGRTIDVKQLTPLPKALTLQKLDAVKLMHDVSEGGLLGALLEISSSYNVRIRVGIGKLEPLVVEGFPEEYDILSAPTYGALLFIVGREADEEDIIENCEGNGYPCSSIGVVEDSGIGVVVGDKTYTRPSISPLVLLYGSETPGDEILARVKVSAKRLEALEGFRRLVPEVGTNIAYSKPQPRGPEDVVALDGRIVKTRKGVRVCGEPAYGASKYLANVLLAAWRSGLGWRAAINIRYDPSVIELLEEMGFSPVRVYSGEGCPVVEAITKGKRSRVYYYAGIPGLESSIVIMAKSPEELVCIVKNILRSMGNR